MPLPTNRTTASTIQEHLDDHNDALHPLFNTLEGAVILGAPLDILQVNAGGTAVEWAAQSGSSGLVHDFFTRTAGNLTLNTTTWANLPTIGTSWDITLAAAAGDTIECSLSAVLDSAATNIFFDVVSIVSAAVTNSFSTGATPSDSNAGVSAWYVPASISTKSGGSFMYTLQAGDVSGGNVVMRLRYRGDSATNRNLHATALFPLQFSAKKLGAAV